MPLQKQAVNINFSGGLDTKTDPNQIPIGKFQNLTNSVFDKLGRLTKRNGFGSLTSLPDASSSYLTTFNANLTAIGPTLRAYSQGAGLWVTKGNISPLQLSTLPLIRNSTNQSQADAAIAPNGLVCTAYTDNVTSGSTTIPVYRYAIADSVTGQNLIQPTTISSPQGVVTYSPRVFSLGNYFVVAFATSSASSSRLQYFAVAANSPSIVGSVTDISTSYAPSPTGSFDGVVANNSLYFSWNGASSSGIKAAYLTANLGLSSTVTIASTTASIVNVTSDITGATPVIWTSTYVAGSNTGRIVATNQALSTLFSSRQFIDSSSAQVMNIAATAQNGVLSLRYEQGNSYSYSSTSSNLISQRLAPQATGSLTAQTTLVRSVGLASKGFIVGSQGYFLAAYQSPFQPTDFLLNSAGGVVAKLAYSNASGYFTTGLPSVSVNGLVAQFPYLIKDSVEAVNKDTNVAAGTQTAGIYSQTGVNLATITFGTDGLSSTEIGSNLNLNGGFLWGYDGYQAVENNFHLYPDNVVGSSGITSGSMSAQQYFYQATYEWSDNQGNVFRSAPSIPASVLISSGTATQVTIRVPTLRLTYKTANPAKIVIYRWSAAQPVYYQVTSIQTPILNDTTIDQISFTDVSSDAAILGNNIIYTNGGVVENIAGPACSALTLFDSRLWLIDAEDPNLLWYSKQVIEGTPVEMSDLFTLFVTPNAASQGPTGPITSIAPMDEKLIIFKKNAIYYINGAGPDNTGTNYQYSQPTFITGTVGTDNQNSIVLTPSGLMFQSDKGIWLLGRDLSTQYVGKDVEAFNNDEVLSSVCVPGTNQVRFTLESGTTLMYDYFVGQWGTFDGIPGISSTLYQNIHTFINSQGQAFQESPGSYIDGSRPVVMSFTTGFISLAALQGYQRLYQINMLGTYQSPHKLVFGLAYDYDSSVSQAIHITPTNPGPFWGDDANWGSGGLWGGETSREQWELNIKRQQCQSFQLSFNEYFDASLGVPAGAGLTISGLNLVAGVKKGYPRNIGVRNNAG